MLFNKGMGCVRLIAHPLNGPRLPRPFGLFVMGSWVSSLADGLSSLLKDVSLLTVGINAFF